MERNKKLVAISFLCWIVATMHPSSGVTCIGPSEWGGRFGDQMIMYVKSRWIAYKYDLLFFYKPFCYSDQLMMHELDTIWQSEIQKTFEQKRLIKDIGNNNLDTIISKDTSTLYIVHYYFMQPQWGPHQKTYDSQEICEWKDLINDKKFREDLRSVIAPRISIQQLDLPANRISVAVHVRKGGGFDHPLLSPQLYDYDSAMAEIIMSEQLPVYHTKIIYSDRVWPLKFPPDQYYIEQIKHISDLLNNAPLYVHLFTDHQDPSALAATYQAAVNKPNIIFGCREQDNHHSKNVLEDLFAMAQCDCLIRSGSNFPQISQLIGKHRIVIYPQSAKWLGKTMVVDQIGIWING